MYTAKHAQKNKQMLAVALAVTAENYDRSRDGTEEFHKELETKVFEALEGFDTTRQRKRGIQAKALRIHRGVVTKKHEQKRQSEMIERMEEQQ